MDNISSTLEQIATTHPNPILFASGVAMALVPLIETESKKYKASNRQEKVLIRGKGQDRSLNDVFVSVGINLPTPTETSDCMLKYDPTQRPSKIAYSHEANRAALYIGTQKEFDGPFFADTSDMGIVVYILGLSTTKTDELTKLILNCIEKYKKGERGFYSYTHGQEDITSLPAIWRLGLLV